MHDNYDRKRQGPDLRKFEKLCFKDLARVYMENKEVLPGTPILPHLRKTWTGKVEKTFRPSPTLCLSFQRALFSEVACSCCQAKVES